MSTLRQLLVAIILVATPLDIGAQGGGMCKDCVLIVTPGGGCPFGCEYSSWMREWCFEDCFDCWTQGPYCKSVELQLSATTAVRLRTADCSIAQHSPFAIVASNTVLQFVDRAGLPWGRSTRAPNGIDMPLLFTTTATE